MHGAVNVDPLFDAADALLVGTSADDDDGVRRPVPDLPLPSDWDPRTTMDLLELRDVVVVPIRQPPPPPPPKKGEGTTTATTTALTNGVAASTTSEGSAVRGNNSGGGGRGSSSNRGWFARRPIAAGTVLLVEKPLAMTMAWEEEDILDGLEEGGREGEEAGMDAEDEEDGGGDNMEADGEDDDREEEMVDCDDGGEEEEEMKDADVDADADADDAIEEETEDEEQATPSLSTGLLVIKLMNELRRDPSLWSDVLSTLYPRDDDHRRDVRDALLPRSWKDQIAILGPALDVALEAARDDCQSRSEAPRHVSSGPGTGDVDAEEEEVVEEVDEEEQQRRTELRSVLEATDRDGRGVRGGGGLVGRLAKIVRCNALSVETSPELFSHPHPQLGHAPLSGTGLYHRASFFNHSHRPNVSRWAIGDVMVFVTNRKVAAGEEACISYVEHEMLCEDGKRRTAMIGMDFVDEDGDDDESDGGGDEMEGEEDGGNAAAADADDEDEPDRPIVDAEVQSELMEMMPLSDRLDAVQDLIRRANDEHWFRCDVQHLRILQAFTLDWMGRHDDALRIWEGCVAFATDALPPFDESIVAVHVQAAMCARCSGRNADARCHASEATRVHGTLFGGGMARFRRRYRLEMTLDLRPDKEGGSIPSGGPAAMDELWPLPSGIVAVASATSAASIPS